jgi:quinohemoprotein ethanol dehydrogenase
VEGAYGFNADNVDTPMNAGSSALVAWNPVQQKAVWSVPTPGVQGGGTMTTAGNLVFQGQMDGKFIAYAADSGKPLWSYYAANGVLAYVSVLTGVNGQPSIFGSPVAQFGWQARVHAKRLLTFVIDGKSKLPASAPPAPAVPLDDPQFKIDTALAEKGKHLFIGKLCSMCHGFAAIAGGGAPDLRASPITLSPMAFAQVVQAGILQVRGMPRYAELSDADLNSLIHYLRARARESLPSASKPQ